MKGKVTWKSRGLRANHWRDSAQARGMINLPAGGPRNQEEVRNRRRGAALFRPLFKRT